MNELQRLVKIIENFSYNSNPLLNLQDDTLLETKLYNLLKQDEVFSDEGIAKGLYGDAKLTSSFRMLKSRFRKKLYNHLHFLDFDLTAGNSINKAIYNCLLHLIEAQALKLNSEIKLSLKLYDQVLKIATFYGINEMMINALEIKRKIYVDLSKEKEFISCNNSLIRCYAIQNCERRALLLYEQTMIAIRGSVSRKVKVIGEMPLVLEELNQLYVESESSLIFYYRHILQIAYLEQTGRYDEILAVIANANKLITSGEVKASWFNHKYNAYTEVYALLQIRQYSKGIKLAATNLRMFPKWSANWFAFMENYILLTLHCKEYSITTKLFEEVLVNEYLGKLGESSIERWELYRRYFDFILKYVLSEKQDFLTSKLVSNLTILPKDKFGFNLALLVLDVLEKLSLERADELEGQAERVRKYAQKYLKGEKAERPRLFLRLLLLALTNPSAAVAKKQGHKLLEKLEGTPFPGDAFSEVEIVPYEHLWEYALIILESKQK